MDRRHLQLVLRHAAAAGCPADPDALLLKRYTGDRDEIAFAELVRRHGRLVWALCRNLLPGEADADDAFQATFLALAKSSGSVRDAARLGPWLHGVAYRVCMKARREAARRKRRQEAASASEAVRPVADAAWDAALAAVHEEVHRLPESLRVAFVLCCLEGKGATEAAEQLGWKLGTLSGRLTRAKEAIIARLEARGIAAAVVGAAVVSGGASGGVPVAVAVRTAGLIADGVTVPSSILALSQGVVGMAVHRTKFLAALVLVAGGLSLGVGSGWLANAGAQQPTTPQDTPPAKADAALDVKLLQADLELAIQTLELQRVESDAARKATQDKLDATTLLLSEVLLSDRDAQAKPTEAAVANTKKWDYDFVLASEMGTTKFVQFLHERETRGWDYVGQTTLKHEGKNLPHWVFRRPAHNVVRDDLALSRDLVLSDLHRAKADLLLDRVRVDPTKPPAADTKPLTTHNVPHTIHDKPLATQSTPHTIHDKPLATQSKPLTIEKKPLAPDARPHAINERPVRAEDLEAQIRALQSQLDALRKAGTQSTKIPRKELGGLEPNEVTSILVTLAKKRFGTDGQKPLQVTFDGEGLTLQGSPEVVKWARQMISRLTEK